MAAAIVYGVSIILEYLASTLYHAIQPARAKRVFRIIDHSCIYLLIAGSYTPFCLITLANDGGPALFFAVWAIAIVGIALECFMRERQPHWVSGLVYLLMGWLVGARRQHLPVHGGDPLRNLATTPAPVPRSVASAIALSAINVLP